MDSLENKKCFNNLILTSQSWLYFDSNTFECEFVYILFLPLLCEMVGKFIIKNLSLKNCKTQNEIKRWTVRTCIKYLKVKTLFSVKIIVKTKPK